MAGRAVAQGKAQTTRTHAVVAGARRWLEVSERSLDDLGGVIGYALDYTDVEEAEAERDRHIAAHREVLERLVLPIVVYGPDMRVRFFNRAYVHAWQFEEAWLEAGPTITEVIDRLRERRLIPEAADFLAYKREKIRQFTSLLEPEEEFLHLPDGRAIRLTTAPHPLGGLILTFEDLTDRLVLERSYNTLIAVQRETLDNLYEGIAVFGGDGRLKLSNPAFARMWDLDMDALAGEPHITQIMARTTHLFRGKNGTTGDREDLLNAILDRTPANRRLDRTDGTVLDYAKVPLPDGATLMSFIDVSDRLRVETALRERTEALEAADRLKSEFIANVSYELRTPLNAIVGFAEILNNQYFGALNDRQGEYVRGIIQASNRLLALINDILDLAMIEAGRMTLETDHVDVHAMMVSVFNLSRDWARKQNQRIEFDCPGDIGQIVADERRLKQALFNLISNAVKFTPAGGHLRVSARRSDDAIAFTVADTGIGIPPEQHGNVFEKFARGKDGSGRFQGVGLGLALVRHIVELHGGTVDIASIPNQGTEVTCRIPAAGTVRGASAEQSPAVLMGGLAPERDGAGLARRA
jgi:signal transduction histidine kinase